MASRLSTTESPIPYLPLANITNEIRLLRLEPRSNIDLITCTISHINLHNPPQYEALSYMWGSKDTQTIQFNNQPSQIRHNLWLALNHLRHDDQPRYLWIDALCIDQNNVLERNHQVMQMHLVYKKASRVIVWLGLADEASSLAIHTVSGATRFKSHADIVLGTPVEGLRAVETFCYRAYWTRLWIIQEILSAREIMLYCGNTKLDWELFCVFMGSCKWDVQQITGSEWSSRKPVLEAIRHSIPFRLCQDRKESRLFDLCIKYGGSSCENPRDKIFGLQSMTQNCCRDASPINYLAEVSEVCCDLLMHAMSHERCDSRNAASNLVREKAHELRKALNIQQFDMQHCTSFIQSVPYFEPMYPETELEEDEYFSTPSPVNIIDTDEYYNPNFAPRLR